MRHVLGRQSVRGLIAVGCLALFLPLVSPIIAHLDGTIYSTGYTEEKFRQLQVGMKVRNLETLMGPPLATVTFKDHMIYEYSNRNSITPIFFRRWVEARGGRVSAIISDRQYR